MRRIRWSAVMAALAVGVCSAAMAAPPQQRTWGVQKINPLPPQVLKALSAPVTREQQVLALQHGSQAGRTALAAAQHASSVSPMSGSSLLTAVTAFKQGVVLTPLAAVYPAGGFGVQTAGAALECKVELNEWTPLPTSGQQPPVAYSDTQLDRGRGFLWLDMNAPEPGSYLVTLSAVRDTGTPLMAPSVDFYYGGGGGPVQHAAAAGDTDPAHSTQWTVLIPVTNESLVHLKFMDSNLGMTVWSVVTIRKL
jgi:hypothetical protein